MKFPYRFVQSLNNTKPLGLVMSEWICFGLIWRVLVRFGVIYTLLGANRCFMV